MKIYYLVNARIPSERAHSLQIQATVRAIQKLGHEVTILAPQRKGIGLRSEDLTIKYVPVLDIVGWLPPFGFIIETVSFALSAWWWLRSRICDADVLYSRDETPLLLVLVLLRHVRAVWETHLGSYGFFARATAKKVMHIVTISQGLKDFYVRQGVSKDKILVAHDGVDLEAFVPTDTKAAARTRLGIQIDKKVCMYVGSLSIYSWKGVDTVIEAARSFDSNRYTFVLIGGSSDEVDRLKKVAGSAPILFTGERPYAQLANNLVAADVLLLPNSAKDTVSAYFTSPLKLFAYMTSAAPIVASRLPSICEVLNDKNSILVTPDDPHLLAQGILQAFQDHARSDQLVAQAKHDVLGYTWAKRAEKITAHIQKDA